MNARRRILAGAAVGTTLLLAFGGGGAMALWSDDDRIPVGPQPVGTVGFAAAEHSTTPSAEYSDGTGEGAVDGTPVTVTLPGSVIADVLDTGHVIWQFAVTGHADGIAGMEYDVSYPEYDDGTPEIDVVYEGVNPVVYPATADGSCAEIPESSGTAADGTVTIAENVLQAPNDVDGASTQLWCVSLEWMADPDGWHSNVAQVTGTATDGTLSLDIDELGVRIEYPPSLDAHGLHQNVAIAEGTAVNGAITRDDDGFDSVLFPDPTNEPDRVITLTPRVTTVAAT